MHTYEPLVGQTIDNAATKMVALANQLSDTVVAEFNGIEVKAGPCKNEPAAVALLKAYYRSECERRSEAYRNSPEGKRATAEAAERKQKMQAQMDEAMGKLKTLDFVRLDVVIDWIEEIRDPSDYIGIDFSRKEVIDTFRKYGFEPNVNVGDDFDGEDKENYARWLIGQALDGLQTVGAIHQVTHKFIREWRDKFGHSA